MPDGLQIGRNFAEIVGARQVYNLRNQEELELHIQRLARVGMLLKIVVSDF